MLSDVVIIGAGASGMICAIEAARRGRKVLVIDHMKDIGSKIRISGGGRCNFTNLAVSAENYLSSNADFCRSALSRFTPGDFMSLLDRYRIKYREKSEGQLFCVNTSGDILNVLRKEAGVAGVGLLLQARVSKLRKKRFFEIMTDKGSFMAESLVVATGGLSYQALGASGLGYSIAREFGLRVTRLRPGLVPLRFDRNTARQFRDLSGTSLVAGIACRGTRISGSMLFTHTGLSGPVILQASLYWEEGDPLSIDLLPGINVEEFLGDRRHSRAQLAKVLATLLPKKLAVLWTKLRCIEHPVCRFSPREFEAIACGLHDWRVIPAGTEGYEKAEVTVGGVDTSELSSKTMEARKVAGLYFIGEVLDVTGQLGGYNLQWAWSSGFAAGQYA